MTKVELGGFSVTLPDAFQHHSSTFVGPHEEGDSVHLALLKKRVAFRPNLVITGSAETIAGSMSVEAYVESQIRALRPLPGFRQLGREPMRLKDGSVGVLQHHAFDNQDGIHVEQYQLYVAFGERALIATTTHLAGAPFQRHEPEFREMLSAIAVAGAVAVAVEP